MTDLRIMPIFNQTEPGIWDDFLRIRDAATCYSCGYSMTYKDFDFARAELASAWKRRGFNFAFGAYDDDKMVAFVQGDCVRHISTIRGLYVLPEYMGQKIGGKLLKLAERATAFEAAYMDLVSLPKAQKFYEHYNYKPILTGSNHYGKRVTGEMIGRSVVLPVFKATKTVIKSCEEISKKSRGKFDADYVNKHHRPMFVYVDSASLISGFIVNHHDETSDNSDELYIGPHQPSKIISSCLNKELAIVKAIRNLKASRGK